MRMQARPELAKAVRRLKALYAEVAAILQQHPELCVMVAKRAALHALPKAKVAHVDGRERVSAARRTAASA